MITNRPLVLAGAVLAFGCSCMKAAITVGYYTDNNTGSTAANAPITASVAMGASQRTPMITSRPNVASSSTDVLSGMSWPAATGAAVGPGG